MKEQVSRYLVASVRSWHRTVFENRLSALPGVWEYIDSPQKLDVDKLLRDPPRSIFFPHWNDRIPESLLSKVECIGFHETDLPFGRGGSPIQNLIASGHTQTMISALRLTDELDAGPIYLKRPLSLDGSAQEIYERSAEIVGEMITLLVREPVEPVPQEGVPTVFRRRTPEQSALPLGQGSIVRWYDHIRMLDAEGYPRAFLCLEHGRLEFADARLVEGKLQCTVTIEPLER